MSEPADERLREAGRWFRYALDDLAAARVLAADPTVRPRQVCWLAQQAAEKALKAALCFLQTEFGKTHNLDALRNLLSKDWTVRDRYPDLAELTAGPSRRGIPATGRSLQRTTLAGHWRRRAGF